MAEYYQYKIRQTGAFRESSSSIFWQNKTVKNSVPEFIKKNIKYWSINVLLVPKRLEVLEHKFSRKENHFKHCLLNWDRSNMHKISWVFVWMAVILYREQREASAHQHTTVILSDYLCQSEFFFWDTHLILPQSDSKRNQMKRITRADTLSL